MKYILGLLVSLGLTGCTIDEVYGTPPAHYEMGDFEYCDDWGCQDMDAPHYYSGNTVFYWNAEFGVWVGPHGYWDQGWHQGTIPGYHYHYDHFRHEEHERHEHHYRDHR